MVGEGPGVTVFVRVGAGVMVMRGVFVASGVKVANGVGVSVGTPSGVAVQVGGSAHVGVGDAELDVGGSRANGPARLGTKNTVV